MDLQNLLSVLASSLFLSVFFNSIIKGSSSKDTTTTNLPPGPRTLPLIGNIHQAIASVPHHQHKKLGTQIWTLDAHYYLKLGEVSNIIVSSPEMAQQIMKTHDHKFSDRPNLFFGRIISYNGTSISFSSYGDYWKQLRKICTMELLPTKCVQSFRHLREEEVSKLVKIIHASEGSIVNLSKKISSMTYGIASRAAFGEKNRHQQLFISYIEEAMHLAAANCTADLYPSLGVLQKMSSAKARFEEQHRETDKILQDIRRSQKIEIKAAKFEGGEVLVDVLLKLQQEMDSEHSLTDDNIRVIIIK